MTRRPSVRISCRDCALFAPADDADAGVCQRMARIKLAHIKGPIGDSELSAALASAVVGGGDGCPRWIWRRPE